MPDDTASADEALTWFRNQLSRHLVCLGAVYLALDRQGEPTGKQEVYAYTSFVYVQGDAWFLVTAGHILDRISQYKKHPKGVIKIYLACLAVENPGQILPVHFADFDDALKDYRDDDSAGLDYGWVYLRPYYRQFLEKDGIQPLRERGWLPLDAKPFHGQVLAGYPTALLGQTLQAGGTLSRTIEPVILSVNQYAPAPGEVEATTFRRYVGRITPRTNISIEGTSGGPIFGLAHDDAGQLRYWLLALQSSQSPDHTLTFGCPAEVFIPRMLREISAKCEEKK
jgi:hypothetical protein